MSLSTLTIQHTVWKSHIREIKNGMCWLGMKAGVFLKASSLGPSTLYLNAKQTAEPPYLPSTYWTRTDLWTPWNIITNRDGTEKMSFSFPSLLQHAGPTLLGYPLGFGDEQKPLVKHLSHPPSLCINLKVHLEMFKSTWQFHAALEFLLSAGFQILLNSSVSSEDRDRNRWLTWALVSDIHGKRKELP